MEDKRWFITEDDKVRWVKCFITKDIEWDSNSTHLIVSMENELNEANGVKDVEVESIDIRNFFTLKQNAQMEIIRRERFENKRK